MAQGDLGHAVRGGEAVQRAAPQPRAQSAGGFTFGNHPLDDAVSVLFNNVKRDADAPQIIGQHLFRKTRLLLVEVDRHQLELHRRPRLQVAQNIEQREGILAAGQANHHPVAVLDHVEILNGPADVAPQPLLKLIKIVLLFPDRRRHRSLSGNPLQGRKLYPKSGPVASG